MRENEGGRTRRKDAGTTKDERQRRMRHNEGCEENAEVAEPLKKLEFKKQLPTNEAHQLSTLTVPITIIILSASYYFNRIHI